jgi:hypothetical protein
MVMTLSDLIFVAGIVATAAAVIVPLARAALGNADDAEYKRQHVDAADQAIEVRGRIARSALNRGKRQRARS